MNKFNEKLISLNLPVQSWREAIKQGGEILLKEGYITENYINKMIKAVEDLGPYIVLAPGIAFAHSSPGEYINKTGISLITFAEPVVFGHETNDPVKILFTIASVNTEDHLELLKKITIFLQNEENIDFLWRARTTQDKKNLVNKIRRGE